MKFCFALLLAVLVTVSGQESSQCLEDSSQCKEDSDCCSNNCVESDGERQCIMRLNRNFKIMGFDIPFKAGAGVNLDPKNGKITAGAGVIGK